MEHLLYSLLQPLEWFARGGGGGSSGGGGGGGSVGGSGGSGFGGIELLLGYLPMHFLGALIRKSTAKNAGLSVAGSVIGWVLAVAYAGLWLQWWPGFGIFIGIAALVGMPAGLYSWFSKIKQSPLIKGRLQYAAQQDSAWDEEKLLEYTKQTFLKYQQDWSTFKVSSMKSYMTDRYYRHAVLLMETLKQLKRKDLMEDVTILSVAIIDMNDAEDNKQDSYTVGITATAHDTLVEALDDSVIFKDNSTFTEYWTFRRSGKTWLLDGISQSTANPYSTNNELAALAVQNGYYYSEDMGWLFIPKRGLLFGGAKFGTSDINNHIVGLYGQDLLVQLYSYTKDPQNNSKTVVIAQVAVPRNYGHIVVRRNKMLQLPVGGGLKRVETEWTQFNKKYEVFASGEEQATSFELLNPTYMEQLEALPFEVNIEVVDNTVYLYTDERGSTADTYGVMLDLLQKAFKEMRL